jgi:hypothetical protein
MKFVNTKTCALALAAALSMPAFSQGTAGSGTTSRSPGATTASADTTTVRRDNDRGFDWGWLGLIGLAGLMGRRRQPDVHRTDGMRTTATR